ncbi:MAG TPA: right-handed parallel beta-helix repeat-containing protein [Thermoanaerobaculia bacterium]|nr:right-handed parallel beta-helix repeat-containing protein [Thermoanaerobaculia bacterium]
MKTLLLLLFLATPAAADVLRLTLSADEAAADRAAGTMPARVTISNLSNSAVEQVRLTLDSNLEVLFDDPAWSCTGSPNFRECTYSGSIDAHAELVLPLTLRFPRGIGRGRINAYVTYGPQRSFGDSRVISVAMWRPFLVTSSSDAGAGTLRAAIEALNADPECRVLPCRIEFALPAPAAGGWSTIMPATPLPTIIGGDVSVDATTQADTNPLGPDVELIGTSVVQGNGLYLRGAQMSVRGLAIGGFPDNGILYFPTARGSLFTIERNYIGVDATGTRAIANGSRGIVIAEGIVTSSAIRENVISGNFRSGIFIVTQTEPAFPLSPVLTIAGNRIGVAAASDAPIPNGASGIFVGPNAEQVAIAGNVIAHNAHFGVAVSRTARYVQVQQNRIFGHPGSGIDINLDGPSVEPATAIESARYEAATDTTTIVLRGPRSFGFPRYSYAFYANTTVDAAGFAEGEQFLGTAVPDANGTAVLSVKGDLRGKYVDAVITFMTDADGSPLFATSEFLRAVRVE